MRVISGSVRGLKLLSPIGDDTRPTLDRVKEAVFSMLTPYLYSAAVLDLFAGSGALGIEALSRGAKESVFVDSMSSAINIVKQNVSLAHFEGKSSFHLMNAADYIKSSDKVFDIVFLDPPYQSNLYYTALDSLYNHSLIHKDSVVVMEWDRDLSRPEIPSAYSILKERHYGRVMITLLSTGG